MFGPVMSSIRFSSSSKSVSFGTNQAAFEHLLNDRVASLFNLHDAALIDGGHNVVVLECGLGKACQHGSSCATADAVRWMRTISAEIDESRSANS